MHSDSWEFRSISDAAALARVSMLGLAPQSKPTLGSGPSSHTLSYTLSKIGHRPTKCGIKYGIKTPGKDPLAKVLCQS
jgi:hypothetical protein